MSVILRPRTASTPMHAAGFRPRTGRGLAGAVTSGAFVLALVLAATIPVRADKAAIATNLDGDFVGTLDR